MEDLLTLCDKVVDTATRAGADEAEVIAFRGKDINVELQKNDLQIAKSMSGNGLGLRVFRGGSLGFAYVNSFDEGGLSESVERAMGIAAGAPPDEHNGLPEPTAIEAIPGIFDGDAESFTVGEAVERALEMLRVAREFDARVTVDSGELSGHYGEKAIATSRGVRAHERSSFFYCYIFGMAKEGEKVSSFDYQFDGARSAASIDCTRVARTLAENVVRSLGAVKGESFRGPVVLAPKAASEIVLYPIEASVRASSVQKETSKFRGKLNQVVASELLNITDDATLENGSSTTSFDREGVAPQVLPIIEKGVLRSFLYDAYTAHKDGMASNGHAGGGVSSVPSVSTSNVVVAAGETALDDIVSGVDMGVLATRFSGNTDPVSGDFSGSIKGGRMIRGGKLAEPLCGTMMAGNIFDLLPRVSAVSRERERLFSSVVPYIVLEDVAVTGG